MPMSENHAPIRITRRRTPGWRTPLCTCGCGKPARYVGRPSRWGNPWAIGDTTWLIRPGGWIDREPHPPLTREQAIGSFRNQVEWYLAQDPDYLSELRGHDLSCWCPEGSACHADILIELASGGEHP